MKSSWGCVLVFFGILAIPSLADAQTKLSNDLEVELLADYELQPLQGIDSIVGKIVKKDGLTIQYDIGSVPKPGAIQFGGQFVNQAEKYPATETLWKKKQTLAGNDVHIAYTKSNLLIVSQSFQTVGVTFSAEAKNPEEIAEVLLTVLSVNKIKQKKK